MDLCPRCDRHLLHAEAECPFCGGATQDLTSQARLVMASGVTMIVLAACYGVPYEVSKLPDTPHDTNGWEDTSPLADADGDGVARVIDCDDDNPDVFPRQIEDCADGIDNDCDTFIDADDPDCRT
ncbi:MAG: putative metal-binding motif [Pseudomonadota bacterium]